MAFSQLLKRLESSASALHVVRSGPASVARIAQLLIRAERSVVVVASNATQLKEYRALLTLFSPHLSSSNPLPTCNLWERAFISLPQYPSGTFKKSLFTDRMAALYALSRSKKSQGILLTFDNFLIKQPPASIFDSHELRLYKGMEMDPELVLEQAIDWGYVRTSMVSAPGEVAVRGDILDIFCPGYQKPIRLEFFGDTLDDLRLFDSGTQRSVASLEEMYILPVQPIVMSKTLHQAAEAFWKKEVKAGRLQGHDVAPLTREAERGGSKFLPGIFYENASIIEDWLPKDSIYLLPAEKHLAIGFEETELFWNGYLKELRETEDLHFPHSLVLHPQADAEAHLQKQKRVYFEDLRVGLADPSQEVFSFPEKCLDSFQGIFPQPEAQERPWPVLVSFLQKWVRTRKRHQSPLDEGSGYDKEFSLAPWFTKEADEQGLTEGYPTKLVLSFASERSRSRFLKLVEQNGIVPYLRYDEADYGIFALISPFRRGAALGWDGTLVLGEDVLQPRVEQGSKQVTKSNFQGLDRYDSLQEGDYLVHRDYGVGIFGGLHRMKLGNAENDYLLLLYAADDKLYVPVDRLSLIQKFKAGEESQPVLDKLGGNHWSSSKEKARKAIEKIAADLVEMYALRKVVKGFRYSPLNEMYHEFEASFGFEETPDQAKAIEDVLADMEKPEPMDRLICGDVGFGKTEVALRAAFRAALEGKQAVLLCPTTILAEQHYQTFKSRLAGFPVITGMLSRFVSKAKQKEVIEAAAKGQIDILIGTHRLLSKDIILPNLGLLILDEEQRFGVRHKERLKEMRNNIDSLTLTATPIPRTLQLSLSGIRGLSIIETPPPERKPVATALIERNDAVLKDLLERELARQGQVFWVYNRVQGLERVSEYVKKLVPSARVGMAHGQMNEAALEKTMHGFWHGELDVLVCTSIVESGLDFPRANTLIVDQAQMFGLGQLYQLRGRVGRSDRQAFAIFITPDPDRLPDLARQRLRVILDLDTLGAGFQVAMEDLHLRGAGNILGESQSGHMSRLGLDLFLEMLEEAVAKLKGQPIHSYIETELSFGVPAFIPQEFMPENKERFRYYKLLSAAADDIAQQDIEIEIRDRFGVFPPELDSFLAILSFKRRISAWKISKADILPDKIRLSFSENVALDPAHVVEFVTEQRNNAIEMRLLPPATLEIPVKGAVTVREGLQFVEDLLHKLMRLASD